MKILKYTAIFILGLIALILAIALMLPNEYGVSRSILINAPSDKIYPHIADPKAWKNWSVWNQRDPNMNMNYSGTSQGAGAIWTWQSKSEGNGNMKFTHAQQNQQIDYELSFEGMGKPSTGSLILSQENGATKITWNMKGSSEGNLMMKLFAPFMDNMIGPDFEGGLQNLKKLVEQG